MLPPLKILHLEDNAGDVALVGEVLRQEWPGCEIEALASQAEFRAALARGGHDLIVSDFTLVGFDGMEALKITREFSADIPFIFLSGTIGEDRAIGALHAGAQDYVLKDRMKRLVPAIRRVLGERDERRRRRAAEGRLREQAELLDKATDAIVVSDLDNRITFWNRGAEVTFGWTAAEAIGLSGEVLFKESSFAGIGAARAAVDADGHWQGEVHLHDRQGRPRIAQMSMTLIRDDSGQPVSRLAISTDVTQHKADEIRIRELVGLLDKARDAIVVSDLAGRVTFWNQGAERLSGWAAADAMGRQLEDVFGPEARAGILAARQEVDADGEWRGVFTVRNKAGIPLQVEIGATLIRDEAGQPRARLSIATDVTEKKRLEEQYLRAQRLESLGMLAAGISHDFNNILAPILLAVPMLRDHATEPGDLRMIEAVEKAAERGTGLVRQILGFAHGSSGEHRLIQVKHLFRDVGHLIEETFPKNIRLEQDIPSDLWPIKANPTHIHQVLLNLCVNARDAMPHGGTLSLRAENCALDFFGAQEIAGAIPTARPGSYIVLQIGDTGTGIPPEVLARMWEPFFTTKGTGKGTGLGLSTVRGIAEAHAGFIAVQTAPDRGTTLRVYLRVDERDRLDHQPSSAHPLIPRGHDELILAVDDEPNIQALTHALLTRHGYRVLTAGDGTEAVALFAPRGNEIRLVITDLNMPNLDGAALAGVIRFINPAVKILAVSGMRSPGPSIPKPETFADGFMLKPFRAEALLELVHKLLHAETPPPA
jgi:PAS domain S-box-containing protein